MLFHYFTVQQVISTIYLQNSSVIRAPGGNRADQSAGLFPSAGFKPCVQGQCHMLQGKRTAPHIFYCKFPLYRYDLSVYHPEKVKKGDNCVVKPLGCSLRAG